MSQFFLILKAIFTGFLTGLVLALPLGPAGIESVKRTVSKSYKEGFKVALGAIAADIFYVLLINCGLANIVSGDPKTEALFWVISGLMLTLIGYSSSRHNIRNKSTSFISKIFNSDKIQSIPFITGFLITGTNPMTPSLWLLISGTIIRAWYYINIVCYYVFIVSIMAGMTTWLALLNYLALKGIKILNPKTSAKTIRFLMYGILFIGIGFVSYGLYKFIIAF